MDQDNLAEYIDQQRWLMNNGLITDSVKNQLFFCGSIVHKDVQAVEVVVKPEQKLVEYKLYLPNKLLKKVEKYNQLSTATSLFGMWRFKRFLKKEGSLDFRSMLNNFVRDFCGSKWSVSVALADFDVYIDSIGDQGETDESSQQPNKLPD